MTKNVRRSCLCAPLAELRVGDTQTDEPDAPPPDPVGLGRPHGCPIPEPCIMDAPQQRKGEASSQGSAGP